jgi:hypothetical protein
MESEGHSLGTGIEQDGITDCNSLLHKEQEIPNSFGAQTQGLLH